jgi:hypothetical protein
LFAIGVEGGFDPVPGDDNRHVLKTWAAVTDGERWAFCAAILLPSSHHPAATATLIASAVVASIRTSRSTIHTTALRPKVHPNPDFARAPRDSVGCGAVQSKLSR